MDYIERTIAENKGYSLILFLLFVGFLFTVTFVGMDELFPTGFGAMMVLWAVYPGLSKLVRNRPYLAGFFAIMFGASWLFLFRDWKVWPGWLFGMVLAGFLGSGLICVFHILTRDKPDGY